MQMKKKSRANPYAQMATEAGQSYERLRHLPALLALWPIELDDFSASGTSELIDRLQKALEAERRRNRAGHWCYDLNRHIALIAALAGERAHLITVRRSISN